MEKSLVDLENGTTCSSWNYSGQRLAAGSADGFLSIFDARDSASSSFTRSSKSRVHDTGIVKVVWIPPEYGDAVACVCADGTLSLWEEVVEDAQPLQWKLCKSFKSNSSQVLDVQFGVSLSGLKMVAAYSDGHIRVYELLDPLELKNWQLQIRNNLIPPRHAFLPLSLLYDFRFVLMATCIKLLETTNASLCLFFMRCPFEVWEFDQAHQRWLPVAELALPGNKGDQVYSVAWAPNIGRPYEVIAVATHKAIALWHLGLIPDTDGRLSVEQVALLSGHAGEMWQMEWDMSGMTLATSGSDGKVRLWQSNLNGVWHEQAALEPTT
ncbi:Nucleoporin seh1 [Morus notabilis]|uniref:Nucleoporin seh1 n=1 Tax=Morus notabilis TaxID=981085 RepID=W9RPY8_9ROSA|nr:Nucleoporin seh1 [Morus notabilis]